MATLSPELAIARRRLDYRAMAALTSPTLASVTALDAGGKALTREEGERGRATVFIVEYAMKFLTGPGTTGDRVKVRFDLSLSKDYPLTPPDVRVISQPLPWSPHVLATVGSVCIGEIWSNARGAMLVAHLVGHVAKAVLNCDEPDRGAWYGGWNAEAVKYWRDTMNRQPLVAGVHYPTPPAEVTHPGSASATLGSMPGLGLSISRPQGTGLSRTEGGLRSRRSIGGGS